jgi:hypothetical protein
VYRRVLHPLLLRASRDERYRRALTRSEIFFPYFAMAVTYDDRRSRVALRGAGITPTPLHRYFDRLVEFALIAEWGRRPIPRASVARGDGPEASASPAPVRRAGQARRARPVRRTHPVRRAAQPPTAQARSALR